MVSVAAGLLYSLGHYLLVIDTLHVPGHPAPGMAAMAVFFLGVLVGIVALPVCAAVMALLLLRRSGVAGFVGDWLLLVFACGAPWVVTTVVWVNLG